MTTPEGEPSAEEQPDLPGPGHDQGRFRVQIFTADEILMYQLRCVEVRAQAQTYAETGWRINEYLKQSPPSLQEGRLPPEKLRATMIRLSDRIMGMMEAFDILEGRPTRLPDWLEDILSTFPPLGGQ